MTINVNGPCWTKALQQECTTAAKTSPIKRALHASSGAAHPANNHHHISLHAPWKPIIPMFQHALFICLKWISGSSLVFRPSSSANLTHLGRMTVTPVAAREQREWITRQEREWKERLLFQEANHHRSFVHWVTSRAVLPTPLSSHHKKHTEQRPKPQTDRRPPSKRLAPSGQPWSTITTPQLPFRWREKAACYMKRWIITFLIS